MVNGYNERSVKELIEKIDDVLMPAGLLYRVFGRAKSNESLHKKIERGNYSENGKKIQDFLGIRVTLYFSDDIEIALNILKLNFDYLPYDSAIDTPDGDVFSAKRFNLIFKIPEDIDIQPPNVCVSLIENTFEVQIRTVLSEGWHEVEHDLRYKNKSFWSGHDDLSRALNGIYATLETSDWGMIKLFEELSHRHYKDGNPDEMLKTKFRLRLPGSLSVEVKGLLCDENDLLKKVFRAPRNEVIKALSKVSRTVPLTPDLLIHVINRECISDPNITKLESDVLKSLLDSALEDEVLDPLEPPETSANAVS